VPEPMREGYDAAAFFPLDAELQPALWVRALVAAAAARGAGVWEGSPVRAVRVTWRLKRRRSINVCWWANSRMA